MRIESLQTQLLIVLENSGIPSCFLTAFGSTGTGILFSHALPYVMRSAPNFSYSYSGDGASVDSLFNVIQDVRE